MSKSEHSMSEDDIQLREIPEDLEEELALCLEILALARRIERLRIEILGPNSTLGEMRDKLLGNLFIYVAAVLSQL
jgi:hypothetical protein